jgi:hypothetical protein
MSHRSHSATRGRGASRGHGASRGRDGGRPTINLDDLKDRIHELH